MPKQLCLGSPGVAYDMIKEMVVASFQHRLVPGFGGNYESVLKKYTDIEKWEGLDVTIG